MPIVLCIERHIELARHITSKLGNEEDIDSVFFVVAEVLLLCLLKTQVWKESWSHYLGVYRPEDAPDDVLECIKGLESVVSTYCLQTTNIDELGDVYETTNSPPNLLG